MLAAARGLPLCWEAGVALLPGTPPQSACLRARPPARRSEARPTAQLRVPVAKLVCQVKELLGNHLAALAGGTGRHRCLPRRPAAGLRAGAAVLPGGPPGRPGTSGGQAASFGGT